MNQNLAMLEERATAADVEKLETAPEQVAKPCAPVLLDATKASVIKGKVWKTVDQYVSEKGKSVLTILRYEEGGKRFWRVMQDGPHPELEQDWREEGPCSLEVCPYYVPPSKDGMAVEELPVETVEETKG